MKTADAIVIGGGVIGLSIACELGRRGVSVVLVERGQTLGAEASSAAAGMLAPQVEAHCADAFFKLTSASRDAYAAFAFMLLEETGIDIEFDQTGTLYLGFSEADEKEITERHHWQTRANLQVVRLTASEVRAIEPNVSPAVQAALLFPLDGQVENRRLVRALATAAERHGVHLLTSTEVVKVVTENERVLGIRTSLGTISGAVVVVAGGAWSSLLPISDASSPRPFHIDPVRGQMLCFAACPPLVRHVIYSPRGYIVPRRDNRLLAGATTEQVGFDKAVTAGGIHVIATHALEIAPAIGALPLVDAWSGLRPRAADGWPVLGACPNIKGLYYATGHYRNGILLAPLTGESIARMIVEEEATPLLDAFSPKRFCHASTS